MNYLEELSYWYFRLNGFLLITDFVNHQDTELARTHDTDFIGIRLPFMYETIGGMPIDFDQRFISSTKKVCIIGEAKSGDYNPQSIFSNCIIMEQNIKRIGCLCNELTRTVAEYLVTNPFWENDEYKIIKVLVSVRANDSRNYITISKNEIIELINLRKEKYRKNEDRLFFSSHLMQFLFSE